MSSSCLEHCVHARVKLNRSRATFLLPRVWSACARSGLACAPSPSLTCAWLQLARRHFSHLTRAQVDELVETFLALDTDGSNAVDARELCRALGKRMVSGKAGERASVCEAEEAACKDSMIDVAYAQQLIDEVDVDKNGQLDFLEFLRVISSSSESALGRMIVRSVCVCWRGLLSEPAPPTAGRSGLFSFLHESSSEESSLRSSSDSSVLGCVCCQEAERCVLMEPCMHVALCVDCNDSFATKKGARSCPICHCKVESTKRVFI